MKIFGHFNPFKVRNNSIILIENYGRSNLKMLRNKILKNITFPERLKGKT